MWAEGRAESGVSRVPTRTRTSAAPSRRLNSGEPQVPQKTRSFPGDERYARSAPAPSTIRNASAATGAFAAKAEPWALRHIPQWQSTIGPSSPSIRYLTAPQRQLPSSIPGV